MVIRMKKEFLNIENINYHLIFEVLNVKVYPKNQSWDIYIIPKVLIDSNKLSLMEGVFSKTYKVKNIKLICKYLSERSYLSNIFNDNWNQMIEIVLLENPGLTGFLNDSYIEFQEGMIIIIPASKSAWSFLTEKNFDKILKEIMIKHYNIDLAVQLKYVEEEKNELDFGEGIKNEEKQIINDVLRNNSDRAESDVKNTQSVIYGKQINNSEILPMERISEESGSVVVEGTVFYVESKQLNNGNEIINFYITDYSNSINCKMFLGKDDSSKLNNKLIEGIKIKVKGDIKLDTYTKDIVLHPKSILEIPETKRIDNAKIKRVELHAHTNMSAMDGIAPVTDLIKRAKEWGHKAIAITDHGVVQAFPEAFEASKKYDIKVLYGVEGYLVNDEVPIVYNSKNYDFDDEFVVFDIETTGLSSVNDKITEIGAVIIKGRKVIASYNSLINPEVSIPLKIVKLTGITDKMVSGERTIDKVLPEFLSFAGDRPLVAHNALFDWGFIKNKSEELGYEIKNTIIDTLELSRNLLTIKKHRLNDLCDHFGINLSNHHRAKDDSEATAKALVEMFKLLEKKKINNVSHINRIIKKSKSKSLESYHIIIIAKNQKGLYNLYKLISLSHIEHFYKKPRILRSILEEHKEGLIIGSACEAGEVFRLIQKNVDSSILLQKAKLYDYFEIQSLANNQFLIDNGTLTKEKLIEINIKIINLGKSLNKPVVATGDLHFIDPSDEVFRRILMAGQGYKDADNQAPLYFKTTDEMLEEFNYLGSDLAYEIVVNNPILIADTVESIIPIPEETFPPKIEGADEQIYKMAMDKAYTIYGESLPQAVKKRLETELNSIINNGYAVMYLIAHKLVTKSIQDGYLVGSRGSVGSSFVATMCDITEVNPLPPHYVCPNCKYSSFFTDHSVGSGVDLEDKLCPNCSLELIKDGHDIPFEVFLGLEGNKEPDIDLNFAGEYQATAHKYAEEIFGTGHVFRAGTIGTLQEKTAYGFVKKYFDERLLNLNQAEMKRLIKGCTGIKRTTGQHPGGVMVVPADHEIYEFTPIQKPADDINSSITTTHFDYRSISGRLLKLDILGHDVPTIIRMLEDITDFKANNIKFDDKAVMSLFTSTEALNVDLKEIDCRIGTLGIPEFGTKFVRQMLIDTKPTTFAELVRISGLSHGTDVWLNNAQDLIKNEVASLKEVISTRDDIMLYLIFKGVDPKSAFKIAENVRKGKGLSKEHEEAMKNKSIPQWYIDSCKIIKYLFPKAHATAYVMMSLRIAYYKIYYPEAFYASYYTVRIEDFDTDFFIKDMNYLKKKWIEFNKKGNNATVKEKNLMTVLEVVYEMYSRGIKLLPVDLYKSSMKKFIITKDGILPPLMTLQGLGINAAISIVKERKKNPFISIEDLKERTKLSKSVIEILKDHGCVDDLPEENQLSLF